MKARPRYPLCLCPATLRKYQAEFAKLPKGMREIKKMRDNFAASADEAARRDAIYIGETAKQRPFKNNPFFFRLICRLREAIEQNEIETAINTLDYLLALGGIKPGEPYKKEQAKNPLACCLSTPEDKLCRHILYTDLPAFGLRNEDSIYFAANEEPARGDVVAVSYECESQPCLTIVRFLEWEWDEILVATADGELVHFRPVTVAVLWKVNDVYIPHEVEV